MAAHVAFLAPVAPGHAEVSAALPATQALRASPAAASTPTSAVAAVGAGGVQVVGTGFAAAAVLAAAGAVTRRGARRRAAGGRRAVHRAATASPQDVEAVLMGDSEVASTVTEAEPGLASLLHSQALPWLPEPAYRRYVRNVPGDHGFDPLGLAGNTQADFLRAYESELKHGRLAMLAGVGFAGPELLHHRFADLLHVPDLMAPGGCTPTLLNGGLLEDPVLAGSLGAIFSLVAFTDVMAPKQTGVPGYYGFDPLRFGDVEFSPLARSLLEGDVEWVAEAEVKHGRAAMLAVTYMAFREFLTGAPTWPSL